MSAIKVREKPARNSFNNNAELTVVEPTKLLIRIAVNNSKENNQAADMQKQEADEKVINIQHGLPPQPKAYLKFPTYDWF